MKTTETKHTKGPWFYQTNSDAYTHIVRPQNEPGRIIVHIEQDSREEIKANAVLIAAAPDMLEFLITEEQYLRSLYDKGALSVPLQIKWNKIKKLIQKATSFPV